MEIIAEFGCNWEDKYQCEQMIDECKRLGIKYIKMQLWKKEQVPPKIQHMHLTEEWASFYFHLAKERGIELFFTPFYPEAVDILERIGVKYYKIRHADYFNTSLYGKIYTTGKKFFVSSDSVPIGHRDAINLFCVPKYPAGLHDYPFVLPEGYSGFSDHTKDMELYKIAMHHSHDYPHHRWFEMHVCLDSRAYEYKWSKTFDELEAVLK